MGRGTFAVCAVASASVRRGGGAARRQARRDSGSACTYVALCGYGLMMLSPVGNHRLTLIEAWGCLGNERNVLPGKSRHGAAFRLVRLALAERSCDLGRSRDGSGALARAARTNRGKADARSRRGDCGGRGRTCTGYGCACPSVSTGRSGVPHRPPGTGSECHTHR